MKILILDKGQYNIESKDAPIVGRYYYLEDATHGTQAQNKAFHALLQEYWKSGLHPKYGGCSFSEFKDQIKRTLGEGFAEYIYATIDNGKPHIYTVDTWEEIPKEVREDKDMRQMIRGKLKSWTDYTVKQRKNLIDNLIDDALTNGVQSEKFTEILEGMNG